MRKRLSPFTVSALILAPVPWLYGVALRRGREEARRAPEG